MSPKREEKEVCWWSGPRFSFDAIGSRVRSSRFMINADHITSQLRWRTATLFSPFCRSIPRNCPWVNPATRLADGCIRSTPLFAVRTCSHPSRQIACLASRPPSRNIFASRMETAVRDFQTPPTRAATQTVSPPTRLSFDLEQNRLARRHSTLSPGSAKSVRLGRARSRSRESSPSSGDDIVERRITRHDTVRNYHSPSRATWEEPGAEPGIDTGKDPEPHYSHLLQECQITIVDYSDDRMSKYELDNEGLVQFLAAPKEDWVKTRWINVNGLSWDVIKLLGNEYNLHRLAIEDLLNTRGRTKADWYADQAFSKS